MAIASDDFEKWLDVSEPTHAKSKRRATRDLPPATTADLAGMPNRARMRLQEHLRAERTPFSSNLSVSEFVLAGRTRLAPVAQVIGACVYHVNRRKPYWQLCVSAAKLDELTRARTEAWTLATHRLMQQAQAARADIVVGVRHKKEPFDIFGGQSDEPDDDPVLTRHAFVGPIEISLTGTAMRFVAGPAAKQPVLSALSGQEVLALIASGFRPVGLAFGCCAYYQPLSWTTTRYGRLSRPWIAQFESWEVGDYTKGFIKARRIAVQRMSDQALLIDASGVLQADVTHAAREVEHKINQMENEREQTGVVITVEAYGTAVASVDRETRPRVSPVVSLANAV
jgi:uncharacterized protein YbjQ (UPF0145 family)